MENLLQLLNQGEITLGVICTGNMCKCFQGVVKVQFQFLHAIGSRGRALLIVAKVVMTLKVEPSFISKPLFFAFLVFEPRRIQQMTLVNSRVTKLVLILYLCSYV